MVFCPNHHCKCNPLTFDILTFQLTSHLQSAVVFFMAFSSLIIHAIEVTVSTVCTLKNIFVLPAGVTPCFSLPYSAWKVWGLSKSCRARGFSYWLTKREGKQVRLWGSANVCCNSSSRQQIFAPVGKSAGQWARSEGWFVFNPSNQALVTNGGTNGVVCHWYTCSALPLQGVLCPVFNQRRKKACHV